MTPARPENGHCCDVALPAGFQFAIHTLLHARCRGGGGDGPLLAPGLVSLRWHCRTSEGYKTAFDVGQMEFRQDHESMPKRGGGKVGGMDLLTCFRAWSKEEQLDQMNTWYCNQCKDHVRAFKKLQLWKLPDILVVRRAGEAARHTTSCLGPATRCGTIARGAASPTVRRCFGHGWSQSRQQTHACRSIAGTHETIPLQCVHLVKDLCSEGQDQHAG